MAVLSERVYMNGICECERVFAFLLMYESVLCACVCMCMCPGVCVCVCLCVCLCVCVCMCIGMCVCVYRPCMSALNMHVYVRCMRELTCAHVNVRLYTRASSLVCSFLSVFLCARCHYVHPRFLGFMLGFTVRCPISANMRPCAAIELCMLAFQCMSVFVP